MINVTTLQILSETLLESSEKSSITDNSSNGFLNILVNSSANSGSFSIRTSILLPISDENLESDSVVNWWKVPFTDGENGLKVEIIPEKNKILHRKGQKIYVFLRYSLTWHNASKIKTVCLDWCNTIRALKIVTLWGVHHFMVLHIITPNWHFQTKND